MSSEEHVEHVCDREGQLSRTVCGSCSGAFWECSICGTYSCECADTPTPEAICDQRHVQRYVSPNGVCWAASCRRPATVLLTSRAAPDEGFPDGLLVEAAYCMEDAFGFTRAVTGYQGGQFISLTPHVSPTPPTPTQGETR